MTYRLLFVLMLLMGAGCAGLGEYYERALTPRPGGSTAAGDLVKGIPTLVGNPANVGAWTEVLQALGYVILGAGGKAGVDKIKKKKAAPKEEAPCRCHSPPKDSETKTKE